MQLGIKKGDYEILKELLNIILPNRQENGGWPLNTQIIVVQAALNGILRKYNLSPPALQVLSSMPVDGGGTPEIFIATAKEVKRKEAVLSKRKAYKWHFLVPLKCRLSPDICRPTFVCVKGTRFYLSSWESTKKSFGSKKVERLAIRASGYRQCPLPPICLRFTSFGLNGRHAWEQVDPAFDLFRALIEITYNWGQINWLDLSQRPMHALQHPEWHLAFSDRDEMATAKFLYDEEPTSLGRKDIEISSAHLESLRANTKLLNDMTIDGGIRDLIEDCLRLYLKAMDSRFRHNSLVSFWQLAEALTLSEEVGGNTKEVCKRLLCAGAEYQRLWGLSTASMKALLLYIAEKRNEIVHKGLQGHVSEHEVGILKLLCEAGVRGLLDKRRDLNSVAELRAYYRLRDVPSEELTAHRSAIQVVLKSRH